MALVNRISRLFRADFHAVLDQIEEPDLLLRQAIREMQDDMAQDEQQMILTMSCFMRNRCRSLSDQS